MKPINVVVSLLFLFGMLEIIKADDGETKARAFALGDIRDAFPSFGDWKADLTFFEENDELQKDLAGKKKLKFPKFDFPAMARPLFKRKRRHTEGDNDLK